MWTMYIDVGHFIISSHQSSSSQSAFRSLYIVQKCHSDMYAHSRATHTDYSGTLIGETVILILVSKTNKLVHRVFFKLCVSSRDTERRYIKFFKIKRY